MIDERFEATLSTLIGWCEKRSVDEVRKWTNQNSIPNKLFQQKGASNQRLRDGGVSKHFKPISIVTYINICIT